MDELTLATSKVWWKVYKRKSDSERNVIQAEILQRTAAKRVKEERLAAKWNELSALNSEKEKKLQVENRRRDAQRRRHEERARLRKQEDEQQREAELLQKKQKEAREANERMKDFFARERKRTAFENGFR
jgi:hypothetical protein